MLPHLHCILVHAWERCITGFNHVGQVLCMSVRGTHCQKYKRPSNFLCNTQTCTQWQSMTAKGSKAYSLHSVPSTCSMGYSALLGNHLPRFVTVRPGGVGKHRPSVCMSSTDIQNDQNFRNIPLLEVLCQIHINVNNQPYRLTMQL